jgi:hypothetical protein
MSTHEPRLLKTLSSKKRAKCLRPAILGVLIPTMREKRIEREISPTPTAAAM